jgi:hypothetical protein
MISPSTNKPHKQTEDKQMTNGQIIFSESMRLMSEGLIGTTGRKLTMITLNDDGTENREIIDEPEEIHTFAE